VVVKREAKKRAMGFEPTTFTLATCEHRSEGLENKDVTDDEADACTKACTETSDSMHGGGIGGGFGAALDMIARLPLTDAEKAEAVRRLLNGTN